MKTYISKIALLTPMLFVLLIAACAKHDATTNREASPTNSAAPAASPAANTTAASTGEIGIPECDAFLKAYQTCVNEKVPAAVRPTFDSTIANWKKSWHNQAAVQSQRAALVTVCKNAHEQAKSTMKPYGCSF